jgi:hypothetical protein
MTPTFRAHHIEAGLVIDIPASPIGSIRVRSWEHAEKQDGGPAYIVPAQGSAIILPVAHCEVTWDGARAHLTRGCYAQVPPRAMVYGGTGIIIHTPHYAGMTQAGGPIEDAGRLKYIDGCSDSLLICAAVVGEPCLNHLHLPAGTAQTEHTHPSERIGVILRGRGVCKTPEGDADLEPGMFWRIPPETRHSFHTGAESLDVLAWHPDSDFGPSHDAHPMVNRTIVDGTAATDARHAALRTR